MPLDSTAEPYETEDERYEAVRTRDRKADGHFWVGVHTTGVYCRPHCASRTPLRRNVSFYDSIEAARTAGLRPCKRCRPDEQDRNASLAADAAHRIEAALEAGEPAPSLAALAERAGLSRFHLHRVFKAATGLTPAAYAAAARARRMRAALPHAESVTHAIYDAGYGSNGRFYESGALGMTPSAFRAGGAGETIHFAVCGSSLGPVLTAATEKGVCAIILGDDPADMVRELQDRFPRATLVGADPQFEQLVGRVIGVIEHPGTSSDLPLDVRGTAFQQRVWQALRAIPPGRTATYAEIASAVGAPEAVRAVANACGANPLAVAIPCHRVVRTDGGLGGYRWGIERKQALLAREGMSRRALEWPRIEAELDAHGVAVLGALLSADECADIAARFDDDAAFRSTVVMAKHGFGRGVYRYFAYPLPDAVAALRTELYARLAPVANGWHEKLGEKVRFPPAHRAFLDRCHAAGQTRPTPLLLRYGPGDYNCLHQDLYGEHVFPIQVVVLLSRPGEDFEGGEFVLTEQRPRMQSVAQVVPLRQGEAAAFAVNRRPAMGSRGSYRVTMRHGVSRVRAGLRHTLGIIFHDAA